MELPDIKLPKLPAERLEEFLRRRGLDLVSEKLGMYQRERNGVRTIYLKRNGFLEYHSQMKIEKKAAGSSEG